MRIQQNGGEYEESYDDDFNEDEEEMMYLEE